MDSWRARAVRALVGVVLVGGVVLLIGGFVLMSLADSDVRVYWAVWFWRDPSPITMPVAGVEPTSVKSSFGDPRPGNRKHDGADIFAPAGTPIVSATDGVVTRVGTNGLGGNVVWVAGEGHALYCYAHLKDWAPGLHQGQYVNAGDLFGYVGNTGDARNTPSHLHFAIHRLSFDGILGEDPVPSLAGARVIPRLPASEHPTTTVARKR
jgi:murein DD-endopeptidase MepM/ murein hydrolase activator NlpD